MVSFIMKKLFKFDKVPFVYFCLFPLSEKNGPNYIAMIYVKDGVLHIFFFFFFFFF